MMEKKVNQKVNLGRYQMPTYPPAHRDIAILKDRFLFRFVFGFFGVFFLKNNNLLTLVLLNPDMSCLSNSVDPDQLASEEAN